MNKVELKIAIENASQEVGKYQQQKRKLESRLFDLEQAPKLRAMVGKCFKYRNSYGDSCDEWWLYSKITGYDSQGHHLVICTFQTTSLHGIEVVPRNEAFAATDPNYYLFEVPITRKQFNANLNRAIKHLEKMRAIPK